MAVQQRTLPTTITAADNKDGNRSPAASPPSSFHHFKRDRSVDIKRLAYILLVASLLLVLSYSRLQCVKKNALLTSYCELLDKEVKKNNEYENKLKEMKESHDQQVAEAKKHERNFDEVVASIRSIKNHSELENLWIQTKSPSFCEESMTQQYTRDMRDINIHGLEPFNIEIYRANDIVSDNIRRQGAWDLPKLHMFQNIVRDYSREKGIPFNELTFVDIGSNIGWFSLSMAAMGLRVMSFEPMPSNINKMKKSLCTKTNIMSGVSSRIQLFTFGLGPKEESCIVISGLNNEGDGHTLCGKTEREIRVPHGYAIRDTVVTKRLDDVASSEGKNIALVKIDVEGYETHVVEGGRNFLLDSKIPFIIAEFVPQWIRKKDGDPERMINRFYDAGYKILKKGHHLSRAQATNTKQYQAGGDDVIFQLVE
mmetsp:Transcript_4301/g.6294  ORF Transcript_4301/g.6294 Transcript_4301/m.6294 type:complete len:425 (-) Transcript_4301:65-1339(-)|eukprot:CAMPEP_0203677770 /NCGR_PEP_ID=MMETSP0090-20130426/29530_1 /ASSEMBLY_ACC=CAM_ASM_001088 /TAXON_ID=426623 /ORGANISM="Chaetoceros affinis, Strain CCMP159" /LENGTH=424 /DNA_ID=CAMNT_0050544771 /DNA_START=94 /DNA_END=1368 /DNA_ORIENTATION=+